jgi:hypothetical protein
MENNDNNKKKTSKSLTKKKNDKLSSLDRAQINELLSESIQGYIVKVKKDARDAEESVDLIRDFLTEFLQAFMIFGYDMKGNPLCIHYASNQMDSDAINSLINRVIFNRGE